MSTSLSERAGAALARAASSRHVRDSSAKGRLARNVIAIVNAAVCAYWIGPFWSLGFLALYVLYEFAVSPWAMRTQVVARLESDPDLAQRIGVSLIFFGSLIFTAPWAMAWGLGGEEAAYVAAVLASGVWIHALTYYSNSRSMFLACIAPAAFWSLVMPFFAHSTLAIQAIMLTVGAQGLFRVFLARRDRNALLVSLKKTKQEVKAANEANAAKTQFLATMSHELRTPLNAIIGYSEMLDEDLSARKLDEHAADAERIQAAARTLLGLINDVLDLSAIEAGRAELKPEDVELDGLIAGAVDTSAHLARANRNTVRTQIAPGLGAVIVDRGKLAQCLTNLVSNACKFTQGGEVFIEAALEQNDGGETLRIAVRDTGPGIAPAEAARLFQPFVQGDGSLTRKHGGTGLGLFITRRLAQLMGGDVALKSAPGVGSTFTLSVAIERARAAALEAAA